MTELQTTIVRRRIQAVLRLLAVGGVAAMLAGCNETTQVAQRDYPNDYRLRHPITLKEGDRAVELFVGRNRGGLTAAQRAEVLSFAQLWRHEATSGIIVDVPKGGSIDRAAAESMREVQSILTASGVPKNAIYTRNYRPSNYALASIKINYSKIVAEAGPCGQWPTDIGINDPGYFENRPYWNFGCAHQRNLAAMIDNPAALVQPRGETPPYAPRRSIMVDKYRKGENPSGAYNGYDAAKISGVGK
jgi:pilus assembly protein CpaD